MAKDDIFHKMKGGSVIKAVGYGDTPAGKREIKHAKHTALQSAKKGKREKILPGDDRHPDSISYEKRVRKNPRYSRAGVRGLQS